MFSCPLTPANSTMPPPVTSNMRIRLVIGMTFRAMGPGRPATPLHIFSVSHYFHVLRIYTVTNAAKMVYLHSFGNWATHDSPHVTVGMPKHAFDSYLAVAMTISSIRFR